LLVRGNARLVQDLLLDIVGGDGRLGLKGNGLDEDLHSAVEAVNRVESRLTASFKLFASEDETLLVGRDALLVLDLCLDVVNGDRGPDLEGNGLACQGLDEDLHSTAEAVNWVESQLVASFKLLAGEDETLLVGRDAALVLDLHIDVVDGGGLDLGGDGLVCQGLDEDLRSTAEAGDRVEN